MILLFSGSFRFGRKSSGLTTVFWPLLPPSKMNFIYTFFPCCLLVSLALRNASVSGRLDMQIFVLPFNSDSPRETPVCGRPPLGLAASSSGVSHQRSFAVESFQAYDSRGDNDVTSLGFFPPQHLGVPCVREPASDKPCGGTSCQVLHCSPAIQMCFDALKKHVMLVLRSPITSQTTVCDHSSLYYIR